MSIDCIDSVPAPAWPALVAVTAGHEHQWAPTNLTIHMGCSFDSGATMTGSRLRRYACLICGAVEDRPEGMR